MPTNISAIAIFEPSSNYTTSDSLITSCCFQPRDLVITNGKFGNLTVGTSISEIQRFIETEYITPTDELVQSISLVDSRVLNYLRLQGTYYADVPLMIPSFMVLDINQGYIVAASTLTHEVQLQGTALVMLNNVRFAAVLGGTVDATNAPSSK